MDFSKIRAFQYQRKHLIIVLVLLILLAVIYRFYPYFEDILSPTREIELKEGRLVKYQKVIDSGRNIDKRLDSVQHTLAELESRLLSGKSPSLAAVEVQKIMEDIAGKSGIQIGFMNVLKPEDLEERSYVRVPVEFQIAPTIKQLKEIVYRIETAQKFLDVKKMVIQEHGGKGRQLRCSITVSGLMKRPEE